MGHQRLPIILKMSTAAASTVLLERYFGERDEMARDAAMGAATSAAAHIIGEHMNMRPATEAAVAGVIYALLRNMMDGLGYSSFIRDVLVTAGIHLVITKALDHYMSGQVDMTGDDGGMY